MNKIIISGVILVAALYGGVQYWQKYNTPEYKKIWGWVPTTQFIPLWERKVQTQQVLKLGLLTDTHVHPNRIDKTKKIKGAPRYLGSRKDAHPLELFNEQMKNFQPDAIIHAGDVIEGTNDPDDVGMMGLDLVQKELEKSGVPVHWVVGNHDLRSVNKQQFREILEIEGDRDGVDRVVDYGDYRIITLDANYYRDGAVVEPGGTRHIPGYLHPETLAWLEGYLDTDRRVYIFMHQGAFNATVRQGETADVDAMITNAPQTKIREKLEKQKNKGKASISNAQEFRALLEKYNVDAFINGHLEVARYDEINNVRYYSLTGTKKSIVFPEGFYELVIDTDGPHMMMYYTDVNTREQKKVQFETAYRVQK